MEERKRPPRIRPFPEPVNRGTNNSTLAALVIIATIGLLVTAVFSIGWAMAICN